MACFCTYVGCTTSMRACTVSDVSNELRESCQLAKKSNRTLFDWSCAALYNRQQNGCADAINGTFPCRSGGMAYTTDLKSVARKGLRVRVPPSAP